MGKQINYWLESGGFALVAQRALELGCTIIKESFGKVIQSRDIGIVTEDCNSYYFHLPEAGKIIIEPSPRGERLDRAFNECSNSIIEAGYSSVDEREKRITRSRLYLSTGYYDDEGNYIHRPDCIVKVYESLARYVKKLAPFTELSDSHCGKIYVHKEYVSPFCLDLRNNKGYSLN